MFFRPRSPVSHPPPSCILSLPQLAPCLTIAMGPLLCEWTWVDLLIGMNRSCCRIWWEPAILKQKDKAWHKSTITQEQMKQLQMAQLIPKTSQHKVGLHCHQVNEPSVQLSVFRIHP